MHPTSNRSDNSITSTFRGLRKVPLYVVVPYLLIGYLLFLFGPYEWPIRARWVIYLYIPLIFSLLFIGFLGGSKRLSPFRDDDFPRSLFLIGSISSVVMLFPSAIIYTDKMPWDIAAALADQKETYSALGEQLEATEGARGPVAAIRALFAPFIFCVLPLGVIYWRSLTKIGKIMVVAVILVSIDLSILRGTTRELADLLIVGLSAYLVGMGRSAAASGVSLAAIIRKRWRLFVLTPALLLLVLLALVGRTEARLGGQKLICLADSGVCVTQSEPYNSMNDTALFSFATITGYLSQGYYGVSLAAEKPFMTTYGLGHSPALSALYVMAGNNGAMLDRAYTARARSDGWSDGTQWSSLMTWIANDVGLWGAAIFILLLGLLWGRMWTRATSGGSNDAAVLFCVTMMMVFYLPANNQMMATFDGYAILLFWGARTFIRRSA